MKVLLFAVYDRIAQDYAQPFQSKNEDTATRSFLAGAEGQPNNEDFELYEVGEYDTSNGLIKPLKSPIFISSIPFADSHKTEEINVSSS